jgi:hypothetical protein
VIVYVLINIGYYGYYGYYEYDYCDCYFTNDSTYYCNYNDCRINVYKNINNHKVVIMRLNMIKLTKTTLSGVKMLVKMIRKLPHPIILSYKVRCKIIQMIQIS